VRRIPLLAAALIAGGCGAAEHPAVSAKPRQPARLCSSTQVQGFRTCSSAQFPDEPTIERRTALGWKVVARPLKPVEPTAQWGEVSLSPDGQTLLAEWQYPCDSAAVVFVPAAGGAVRLVTGERDWRKAPSARALGWTRGGKARVRLFNPWRGRPASPTHPRTYLFDPRKPARNPHPPALRGC
jgi:hypothetical protein